MSRFKLSLESMIRQRKLRLIKDPRESMMLDEIIRLRAENEKLQAKPQRKKKETPDAGDSPSD